MSTRTGGRQAMSELKLRRLLEHNQRLREDLARPRVRVSEASARYVLLPSCCHCLTGAQSYTVLQNNKRPPRTSHVDYPWFSLTKNNRSPQCGARLGGRRIPMDNNELIASVVPCSSFSFYPCFGYLRILVVCMYAMYYLYHPRLYYHRIQAPPPYYCSRTDGTLIWIA
ncbi:hypothetical protein EDD85DRAFT_465521 [Armillaria nabsnona]|nr:hypothetical protein EDD85DRAFT_465521 [Armillaria nabsnona]